MLVLVWLNVSLDPMVGKDKKGGRYWPCIYEYFNEHKPCQSHRTLNSLMHHWETIQKQKGRIRSPHEMHSLSYWKATSG
jgi:hypothetical protein